MPNLRLCRETDTIEDPPAPLPFNSVPSWRDAGTPKKEDAMDSIEYAQNALALAESKLEELSNLVDEEIEESYSFARFAAPHDDDGPYAA
ncbi:MAG: hypothetical protein RLN78_01250 [Phycisphaerales bacterium]